MANEAEDFDLEEEYEEEGDYDDEGEDDEQIVDGEEDDDDEGPGPGPAHMELPAALRNIPNIQQILGLAPQAAPQPMGPRRPRVDESDWRSLASLPRPTQEKFLQLLKELQARQQKSLTVLFLGKGATGKSSTVNSILGERAASVSAIGVAPEQVDTFIRNSQGFQLKLLDSPGLLAGDTFNEPAMQLVLTAVQQHKVDVVVYVDRLDGYRISQSDHRVLRGITQALGPEIWSRTVLCLTHGSHSPPEGIQYDEFLQRRQDSLLKAVKGSGAKGAAPDVVVVENFAKCKQNSSGQKVLPNGSVWLIDLMSKVVGCAKGNDAYEWSPSVSRSTDPNKRRRWLVIPIILAQIALKIFVIDRLLEDDGAVGDQYGPFEPETIAENRDVLRRRKEAAERRKQRQQAEVADSVGLQMRPVELSALGFSSRRCPETGEIGNSQTADFCTWEGISCCDGTEVASDESPACAYVGSVEFLTLPSNNLQGTIPDSFWTELGCTLAEITLNGNQLSGTLPGTLNNTAPELQALRVSGNKFHGTIPADLGDLAYLEQGSFSGNKFTGTLPSAFSPTSLMHSFDAADNALTGTIPSLWWTPPHIQYMGLAANQLSGTLPGPSTGTPASFSARRDVHGLEATFRGNNLTGTLPAALSYKLFVALDLGSNQFSGNLSSIESMTYLQSLRLDDNMFTGSLPVISSPLIEVLDFSFNNLSGGLPPSVPSLSSLSVLLLAGNPHMQGALTDDFANMRILSILDISRSGLQHDVRVPNSAGDYLPDWLLLNRSGPFVPAAVPQLMCYAVLADWAIMPDLTRLLVSPSYFHYQGCVCEPGYVTDRSNGISCRSVAGTNLYYLIFASAIVLILLPLLILLAWPHLRARWATLKDRWWSKSGAPVAGQEMSLVATDVQGSTELWEWNNFVADSAMVTHDETMRNQLGKFGGYEVSTEGDAFVCAFHSAEAAVAWALSTQQALLQAKWPLELEDNESFCTKVYAGNRGLVPAQLSSGSGRRILFHGLSVRMGIVTGVTTFAMQNVTSKRMEYKGDLVDKLMAVSDAGSGGQVIIDGPTLEQLADKTFSLARLVPPINPCLPSESPECVSVMATRRVSFAGAANRFHHLMRHANAPGDENQLADRATSSTPLVSAPAPDRLARPKSKGVAVLPAAERILLVDMGVHLVVSMKDPATLIQLGVPGLELRMLYHPPLRTHKCISVGYFEAPAAAISTAAFDCGLASQPSLPHEVKVPDVVICFCAIDGLQAMEAANAEMTETAVKVYLLVLRQLLTITGGYECQQADGCLMLAFSTTTDAVEFCLLAQACLLAHAWEVGVEGLPGCGREIIQGASHSFTVSGPRAKMGLVVGTPTRVCPHTTS
ncbi:hypothetical protein WJX84_001938, partial [Apatococcus fuscideae]